MKERRLGSLGGDTGFSELETVMAGGVPWGGARVSPEPAPVLPGFPPPIHDLSSVFEYVDARDKPGHDDGVRGAELRLVRIEPLLEALPAIRVVVLQRRRIRGVRGDALGVAGLEHEGHG